MGTSEARLTGSPREGLYGATLGFFFGFAAVSLYGPTAKEFAGVLGLSPVLVGLLVAMPMLSGSLLRIPFAAWVDTAGGRKPFLTLLALSIGGMLGITVLLYTVYPEGLGMAFYPLLLLLGLLSGCGIATFSVGIAQVAYWYPQSQQGWALGFYAGLGNIAPGLFAFLLPVAMRAWGLSGAYLAWLVFLVVGTVIYAWLGKDAWYFQLRSRGVAPEEAVQAARARGQEIFPAANLLESLNISARVWKTWVLVVLYFTTFGGFLALTAWLPTYWQSYFALNAVHAGLLTALYSVLTSVIRVPGGSLADRIGGETTALLSLAVLLAGSLLMSFSHSFGLAVTAEILMAVGMGVNNAAVFKLVPQEVPRAVGGAAGWVGGLGAFGGFAIPPAMGWFVRILGPVGYARGFVSLSVLALFSFALGLVLKRAPSEEATGAGIRVPPSPSR